MSLFNGKSSGLSASNDILARSNNQVIVVIGGVIITEPMSSESAYEQYIQGRGVDLSLNAFQYDLRTYGDMLYPALPRSVWVIPVSIRAEMDSYFDLSVLYEQKAAS